MKKTLTLIFSIANYVGILGLLMWHWNKYNKSQQRDKMKCPKCGGDMEQYGFDQHKCLKCGKLIVSSNSRNNNYVAENLNNHSFVYVLFVERR